MAAPGVFQDPGAVIFLVSALRSFVFFDSDLTLSFDTRTIHSEVMQPRTLATPCVTWHRAEQGFGTIGNTDRSKR
jgi:hypothetical protein